MDKLTRQQWSALWFRLTTAPAPEHLFPEIVQYYMEPQRAYHTLTHIAECLAHFATVRHLATQPDLLEVAIWLHDLIYDPTRSDNEAASATWAEAAMQAAGVAAAQIAVVKQLILATQHGAPSATSRPEGDCALMVDIDLAIFGAPPSRFEAYERQIRQEYGWVPWSTFAVKRAALLEQFLEQTQIYQTRHFYTQFEAAARHNLQQSLQNLKVRSKREESALD